MRKIIISTLLNLFTCMNIYAQGMISFDAGSTVTKVNFANFSTSKVIIASNYEGNIIAFDGTGIKLWETVLSNGIMNHEVWIDDINEDGYDEIFAANANGTLYCLNNNGSILWEFKKNDVPLISVCVIHKIGGTDPYVVCGGNDLNMYYVSSNGELIAEIPSSSYTTTLRPNAKWVDDGTLPYNVHTINFLRPLPQSDGSDNLLVDAIVSNTDAKREFFEFEPEATTPLDNAEIINWGPIGDLKVRKMNNVDVLLMGFSGIKKIKHLGVMNLETRDISSVNLDVVKTKLTSGYRVTQNELVEINGTSFIFSLIGERIYLLPTSLEISEAEELSNSFSFNDMSYDLTNNKIVLGSIQSGGNQIHVLDLNHADWKTDFESFTPGGNIASIISKSNTFSSKLKTYDKPNWEREPLSVYMMSEPSDNKLSSEALALKYKYDNVIHLGYKWMSKTHEWDRSSIESETLREQRDSRKEYSLTEVETVDQLSSGYNTNGLVTWGGHGVDPFMFGLETIKKVADNGNGKRNIWIWPELTILHKETFDEALEKLFYPLAEYGSNLKLFLRNKHVFWQSYIYKSDWSRFLSGEFADVLIPSLEETLDQSQDLSLAGRLGLWTSGVSNEWGTRAVRDNASFMRNRQFSHQNLPNHFLRNSIFHCAYGARYVNNFSLTSDYSEYMTLLWEVLGTGALYIPKVDEILSFSPVHLSMISPDERYLREGNSMNATVRYDKDFHPVNPFVFNRLSAEWSGAQVPDYDFSKYASDVNDRRSNFLAPFPNGMVLITPPQNGIYVQENKVRGSLEERLHPFYRGKLKEFYTDGRHYYSADGVETYSADQYATVVKEAIEEASEDLPIKVTGDVAWVVAQTDVHHFRLTLIDNGYLNPKTKTAKIEFNNVTPVKITDLVTKKILTIGANKTFIGVEAGMFRFIDVEFSNWNPPLSVNKQVEIEPKLYFYPNPTKNNIVLKGEQRFNGIVKIINANGQILKSIKVQKTAFEDLSLNTEFLNPGLYFFFIDNTPQKIIIHE
ncbi:T9SS type A sorting domain-containing protein [Flavicella marina]|uniref:T9SS type A sorting domain-containing protein n=1 Tax=Flavicella marina TaxID=1475951 RepID=UPI0012656F0D|nr:T9SS type A sorting domain-containing protein [Flavicella marina]